jgi:hypothetical protein
MEGSRFYLDGKRLETRAARELFAANLETATLFKEAKTKEAVGGFLLGFGIGLTVGDLALGFSGADYPGTLTYVGVSSLVISVPVLIGRKKRYLQAIKIYNEEHKSDKIGTVTSTFELNMVSNRNGMGLQLKF